MIFESYYSPLIVILLAQLTLFEYVDAFQRVISKSAPPSSLKHLKIRKRQIPRLHSVPIYNPHEDSPSNQLFNFHPTLTDRARTIAHICGGGTLCTTSVIDEVKNYPYGSYVDYILDERGWPVLLLNSQSLHTQNIGEHSAVSLFVHLPPGHHAHNTGSESTTAALSRVNIMGKIETIPANEINPLKFAYTLVHPYAEQIADSPKFSFMRLKPERIYFSGGFGVMSTWINVSDYEDSKPDVLAQDVPDVLSKTNSERQGELCLMCKHFLAIDQAENVRIQAIDRLGIDVRVRKGDYTDEFRIGFRRPVVTTEDAKSELMKLFQEVWEREHGYIFDEELPPIMKYAEDILRRK
eukprot:gnl/Spiro4/13752_TR7340_c0_g1_i1.p1 gnl/Spiro4/13752_TR7340_c0_g1~~gnl/Spiro4/13752_TR7340_c0_g1_i1.p1  ORF type:complete len:352 (+),score=-36.95 gnl/Spiro4/13752_TR7340_c0_g1_i1:80-1135(+)